MEARRVDRNTFDIFFGKQWGTWTRVRCNRHGVYRVAGEKVDHRTMKELGEMLAPNMPINYGQTIQQTYFNCLAIA